MSKQCVNVSTCLGLLTVYFLLLTAVGLDKNCVQLPPMKELVSCCKFPEINIELFADKCKNEAQKSSLFGLSGYYNHCTIACIFNISNAIDANGELNLSHIQTLLSRLIQDHTFVRTYLAGFRTCGPLVRQKLQRRKKKRRKWPLLGRSNCSKVPLLYALCAHTEVFINCPANAWTRSAQCLNTRDYLQNCKPKY